MALTKLLVLNQRHVDVKQFLLFLEFFSLLNFFTELILLIRSMLTFTVVLKLQILKIKSKVIQRITARFLMPNGNLRLPGVSKVMVQELFPLKIIHPQIIGQVEFLRRVKEELFTF
jgi:hypothetical protein